MDNRLNKIRKQMNALRVEMLGVEEVMRDHVNHDRDCAEPASRLLAMRAQMSSIIREWTALGGIAQLPTIEERLKGEKANPLRLRLAASQPDEKRKLVA